MSYGLDKKSSQIILNYLKESTGLCGPQYGLTPNQYTNVIEPELTGVEAGTKKVTKTDPYTGKQYEDIEGYDVYGGESTKSQIVRGREEMPPGYDIKYQSQWTNIQNKLNKELERLSNAAGACGAGGLLGSVGNFLPPALQTGLNVVGGFAARNVADVINKQVKAQLAQMYLGKGFGGGGAAELDPNTKAFLDTLGIAIPVAGAASGFGGSQFGVLGDITAKQVQNIAAMGIDPLEWAMNRFGAQQTGEDVNELPKQRAKQALSQAGYLARARARGIV